MNTPENTTRKTYKIESGRPSWHQQKAGHAYSGSLIVSLTPEELADHLARIEAKGEPHRVTVMTPKMQIETQLQTMEHPFFADSYYFRTSVNGKIYRSVSYSKNTNKGKRAQELHVKELKERFVHTLSAIVDGCKSAKRCITGEVNGEIYIQA